jgi:glutamate racemase
VFSLACPLFVPLAEEGWHDDNITDLVAERYLGALKDKNIDTVVLGCTHYPLLKKSIQKVFSKFSKNEVTLIDSGVAIAEILEKDFKTQKNTPNSDAPLTDITICLTDFGPQFESLSIELLSTHTQKKIKFETVAVI